MSIGVCKHCNATDTLVMSKHGGDEPSVCEWCAEQETREHDDPPWDEPDLGEIPDEVAP